MIYDIIPVRRYFRESLRACSDGQTPHAVTIDGASLVFGRRGMPSGSKKGLSEQSLRELLRERLLIGLKVAVAAED
jgi:hypothetical protein